MKILKVEPEKKPVELEINGDLESMQSLVGGLIQAIYPFDEPVALICNEEGKLLGLPLNRALRDPETHEIMDIVCGTFFLCGAPTDSDTFVSLTSEQLAFYSSYYEHPELFIKIGNRIAAITE